MQYVEAEKNLADAGVDDRGSSKSRKMCLWISFLGLSFGSTIEARALAHEAKDGRETTPVKE